MTNQMVAMKIVWAKGGRSYFVGASKEDILADVEKSFGSPQDYGTISIVSLQTLAEQSEQDKRCLALGIQAIQEGTTKSYMVFSRR